MRGVTLGVLACGLVGLLGCFLPLYVRGDATISFFGMRELDAAQTFTVMTAFAAALAMAALAGSRGMLRWQALVAAIAFAFVIAKLRGDVIDLLWRGAIGGKLMALATSLGLVAAIAAVVRPVPDPAPR